MNSDPRTYNSARNLMMSFIQKVVHILLTFVGRQIFLQVLSVEYLGMNRLYGDIISMLSLADLGLMTAMSYSFYKPLAEQDEDKISALIGFYRTLYNIIATVVAVVGVLITPFLRYIINLETDIPYLEVYYLMTLSHTVISYLFVYKSTIITADQKSRVVSKYSMWTSIIIMLIQMVVLLTTRNYMVYSLVPIFGTLANNLIISRKANDLYPFIKKKVQLDTQDKREIFSNIRSVFIYKVASTIFTGSDNIFISSIVGTAVVGVYANYRLAVTNLAALAFMVFTSLTPSIGNLIAKEPPAKRLEVFRLMQTASYWLGGFFSFCLFFMLDDFVTLWLGSSYLFDMPTKIAILVNFYLSITLYPIIAFREATGIYQKTKYVMLAAAVMKIILSIIFGRLWGLMGIVSATTVSKLLTYAWYEPKVLFHDYFEDRADSYLYGHIINFTMVTVCIVFVHLAFPWAESSGWLEWIFKGVVYTVGINALFFLRYFKTPEFRNVLEKVKEILKKTKS